MIKNLKFSGLILILFTLAIMSTSCEKEKIVYQTKVRNACEMDILGSGIPFMKYNITELSLGDVTFTDIAAGADSDYKDIESETEYLVTVKYDVYLYNPDNLVWEFDQSYTEDIGTEEWTATEDSEKFIVKVEIGSLFSGYKPYFETYIAN